MYHNCAKISWKKISIAPKFQQQMAIIINSSLKGNWDRICPYLGVDIGPATCEVAEDVLISRRHRHVDARLA